LGGPSYELHVFYPLPSGSFVSFISVPEIYLNFSRKVWEFVLSGKWHLWLPMMLLTFTLRCIFMLKLNFGVITSQETWKCQGKGPKSGNSCSQGNLMVTAQQNNLPVLYPYCNSFVIRDVFGDFG